MKDFNKNFRITPASCKTRAPPDSSIYFLKTEKKCQFDMKDSHIYE